MSNQIKIVASVILWKHDIALATYKKKANRDKNCFNRRKPHGTRLFVMTKTIIM